MKLSDLAALGALIQKVFPLPIHSTFEGKHHIVFHGDDHIELGLWLWDDKKVIAKGVFGFDVKATAPGSEITEETLLDLKGFLINNKSMHPNYAECDSKRAKELPEARPDAPSLILKPNMR